MEGIWVNKAGNVAETCMGNVAIVDQHDVLRSPHHDGTILAGTTVLRAFALAPRLVKVGVTNPVVLQECRFSVTRDGTYSPDRVGALGVIWAVGNSIAYGGTWNVSMQLVGLGPTMPGALTDHNRRTRRLRMSPGRGQSSLPC